jgi:hypothetical protein
MPIALVCSNDTHVHMLAPVAQRLIQLGEAPMLVPLDGFYRQHAGDVAARTGLPVAAPRPSRSPPGAFYRRPAPLVWQDVLAARRPVRDLLRRLAAERVVVGNDTGLIEKLVLAEATRAGSRSVLVQDGRLSAATLRAGGLGAAALGVVKRTLSPVLRSAGAADLAASPYGAGGSDLICAAGARSAELLRHRARALSRVVVTGQPRFDRLAPLLRSSQPPDVQRIAMFTTPFAHAGLGCDPQRAQGEAVAALRELLSARGIELIVKPHPREDPAAGDPIEELRRAQLAIIGASTVLEEAAILGCPVIVPGHLIHGNRFTALLPDPQRFPRFDRLDEVAPLLERLAPSAARQALTDEQRAAIAQDVYFDPTRPAAAAVAEAILAGDER